MSQLSKNLSSTSPLIKNRFFILMDEKKFLSQSVQKYLNNITDLSLGTLSTFVSNEDVFKFVNLSSTDLDSHKFYAFVESIYGIWRNFILNMLLDYDIKYNNSVDAWNDFISHFEINSKFNVQSIFFVRHYDKSNQHDPIYSIRAIFHDFYLDPLDYIVDNENILFEFQIPATRVRSLELNDFISFHCDSFDEIKEKSETLNPSFN